MLPMPLSGPGPMELGVEQGVLPASCCDIWAILLIGSNPLLDMLGLGFWPEPGVPGFNGMLPLRSGGMGPPCMLLCEGDMPPGSLPPPGEAGTGNLWSAGEGEGLGNLLSCDEGVCGVWGPSPGYIPDSDVGV